MLESNTTHQVNTTLGDLPRGYLMRSLTLLMVGNAKEGRRPGQAMERREEQKWGPVWELVPTADQRTGRHIALMTNRCFSFD
jgi:hypothetical protein